MAHTTAGTPQIIADPGTMVPGTQTETITSGSTVSQAVAGTTLNAGSGKANGTTQINAVFEKAGTIQLQNAKLTITHLLDEDSGAGELVHQQLGTNVTFPIVLTALPNSTAVNAVYATASGVTPRIRAEVIDPPAEGKLQLLIDLVKSVVRRAARTNLNTRLHTQISADDGVDQAAVFDVDLNWQCHSHGARLTVSSSTIAGTGVITAQTSSTRGRVGQSVAAGSFVLANTGLDTRSMSALS